MRLPKEPKPGDRITAVWAVDVVRYLRSLTPRQGPGIEISHSLTGTSYTALPASNRGAIEDQLAAARLEITAEIAAALAAGLAPFTPFLPQLAALPSPEMLDALDALDPQDLQDLKDMLDDRQTLTLLGSDGYEKTVTFMGQVEEGMQWLNEWTVVDGNGDLALIGTFNAPLIGEHVVFAATVINQWGNAETIGYIHTPESGEGEALFAPWLLFDSDGVINQVYGFLGDGHGPIDEVSYFESLNLLDGEGMVRPREVLAKPGEAEDYDARQLYPFGESELLLLTWEPEE